MPGISSLGKGSKLYFLIMKAFEAAGVTPQIHSFHEQILCLLNTVILGNFVGFCLASPAAIFESSCADWGWFCGNLIRRSSFHKAFSTPKNTPSPRPPMSLSRSPKPWKGSPSPCDRSFLRTDSKALLQRLCWRGLSPVGRGFYLCITTAYFATRASARASMAVRLPSLRAERMVTMGSTIFRCPSASPGTP